MSESSEIGFAFWILSFVILISGFMVVSLKNIFHCALFLILCLSGVAGIFILLGAEFLAAAQVLIYVGAVAILIVFAIMLTSDLTSRKIMQTNRHVLAAFLSCLIFVFGSYLILRETTAHGMWHLARELLPLENTITLGKLLMTEYMLPFEVVSILLLAAMIGAIVLARQEKA